MGLNYSVPVDRKRIATVQVVCSAHPDVPIFRALTWDGESAGYWYDREHSTMEAIGWVPDEADRAWYAERGLTTAVAASTRADGETYQRYRLRCSHPSCGKRPQLTDDKAALLGSEALAHWSAGDFRTWTITHLEKFLKKWPQRDREVSAGGQRLADWYQETSAIYFPATRH